MFFPRPPFRGPPPPYLSPSDPPLLQVSLSARRILSHDAGYAKSWMETTAQTGGSPSAKGASSRIPFPLLAMSARAGRKNAGLVAVRVLPLSVSGRSGDILLESTANRLEPLLHSRLPSFLPSFLPSSFFTPSHLPPTSQSSMTSPTRRPAAVLSRGSSSLADAKAAISSLPNPDRTPFAFVVAISGRPISLSPPAR